MFGPKLDARTYAILILAVIGVTLSVSLIAQQSRSSDSGSGSVLTSTADVAVATREVAAATNRVAESNAQIAEALRELAEAVRDVKSSLDEKNGTTDSTTQNPAAGSTEQYRNLREQEPLPVGDSIPQESATDENEGVFEMQ